MMGRFTFDTAVDMLIAAMLVSVLVFLVVFARRIRKKRELERKNRFAVVVAEDGNIAVEAVVGSEDAAKKEILRILGLSCGSDSQGLPVETCRGFSSDRLSWSGTWERSVDGEARTVDVSIRPIPVIPY